MVEECNLFAILDLPSGAFLGTGVKTVVLFFEKGKPTENIWYYQLNVGRNLGKNNSLNESDLEDFVHSSKSQKLSNNSWVIDINNIDKETLDMGVKNPNIVEEVDVRDPEQIISEIEEFDKQSLDSLREIKKLLKF